MLTNHRGIIAEQYSELQGIPLLKAARDTYPLAKASPESSLRAIFQAAEIALLNLEDLVTRVSADLARGALGKASVKMSWVRGFQRLMVDLSVLPHKLGLGSDIAECEGVLRIGDSPGLRAFAKALERLDEIILAQIGKGEIPIGSLLAKQSLDCSAFNLLHMIRVCNHEMTIWENNLAEIHVPVAVPDYDQFVVTAGMRATVYDRVLKGDTFFTQFRGLHQVPEILCDEINDRIEHAIMDIRHESLQAGFEHLRCANILSAGVISALPAMVDNLATSDYHQIRENLGLTSGSHSVGLHFHLFRDLYQQLWEAVANSFLAGQADAGDQEALCAAIRRAAATRQRDPRAFLLHLLGNECLELRAFIQLWRDEHLNLPRNNLGGNRTKSLTGSLDAIKAVKGMRDVARAKDPMQPLADVRNHRNNRTDDRQLPLTRYLERPDSLDNRIMQATGEITQERFPNVQQREGVFAMESPFSPPPRRLVQARGGEDRD
jgi:tryptophan 2,3-dioxygenase